MNKLELILENVRLKHIEHLLTEAQSKDEIQYGIRLINESMETLYKILMEDGWAGFSNDNTWANETKKAKPNALDRTAQVTTSDSHVTSSPEHIPGEPALAKPAVGLVQPAPVKRGLGASLMNRRF